MTALRTTFSRTEPSDEAWLAALAVAEEAVEEMERDTTEEEEAA